MNDRAHKNSQSASTCMIKNREKVQNITIFNQKSIMYPT